MHLWAKGGKLEHDGAVSEFLDQAVSALDRCNMSNESFEGMYVEQARSSVLAYETSATLSLL